MSEAVVSVPVVEFKDRQKLRIVSENWDADLTKITLPNGEPLRTASLTMYLDVDLEAMGIVEEFIVPTDEGPVLFRRVEEKTRLR